MTFDEKLDALHESGKIIGMMQAEQIALQFALDNTLVARVVAEKIVKQITDARVALESSRLRTYDPSAGSPQ